MSLRAPGLPVKRYANKGEMYVAQCFTSMQQPTEALLALQDLDAMRQDLATYAADLKAEQEHAVRMHSLTCSI